MPDENVKAVRRVYEIWARYEDPGPDLFHPDIEYVNPPSAAEPGVRRGAEAFREAAQMVRDTWEEWVMEPEELTAVGDQVIVVLRYRARGRASGVEIEGRESALFTLRDGRIVRYAWFSGPDDAQQAAEGRA